MKLYFLYLSRLEFLDLHDFVYMKIYFCAFYLFFFLLLCYPRLKLILFLHQWIYLLFQQSLLFYCQIWPHKQDRYFRKYGIEANLRNLAAFCSPGLSILDPSLFLKPYLKQCSQYRISPSWPLKSTMATILPVTLSFSTVVYLVLKSRFIIYSFIVGNLYINAILITILKCWITSFFIWFHLYAPFQNTYRNIFQLEKHHPYRE